jgi:hypothetical protein
MRVLALTSAFCLAATPVLSWDREAHEAVALLAEQQLTDGAKRAVTELLNGQRMADVVSWPEDVRNTTHRETYNWHFVNIPLGSNGYDPRRDCQPAPRGDCIIAALERAEQEVATPSATSEQRRVALIFLIHLIADLHQPLHVSDNNDRGGNGRPVEIADARNLHSAWDSGIIHASGKTVADLISDAKQRAPANTVTRGSYADWAMEGFAIARDVVYKQVEGDERIVDAERGAAIEVISTQIARAGARLAAVIERTLGSPSPRR